MGKRGSGVKPRGLKIQVAFSWMSMECRETLNLKPTPPNLKYAERLKVIIDKEISNGSFEYAKYFPESRRLKRLGVVTRKAPSTFEDMADKWLASCAHLQAGTLNKYAQASLFWQSKLKGPIIKFKYSDLAALVNNQGWKAKHRNNMLIALRQTFELAKLDGEITVNPTDNIKNAKAQREPPDPLAAEELEAVLIHMRRYSPQIINYFDFAFFSGLRPSEQIALTWSEIDWNRRLARIRRARTYREVKATKTYRVRDVELSSRALAALQRQRLYTQMKKHGYVFENPVTKKPFHEERPLRRAYWIPTLKALGMRHRDCYQTRHTYATLNLMAGANPMWVARQLGHSSMQMVLTVYSRWIDQADKSREREKLDAMLNVHIAQLSHNQNANDS